MHKLSDDIENNIILTTHHSFNMNETPSHNQYYYNPLTLPSSDDHTLFHLAQGFGHDTDFNTTSLHGVYPFDLQFSKRDAEPHHQYYYDQSIQNNSICPPSIYLGQGSYISTTCSTSSADPINYEFKQLQEFNDHQELKENQYYQQTHIFHQNQESHENQDFQRSVLEQDIEQHHTLYSPNSVSEQTAKLQQNQAHQHEELTEQLVPQLQQLPENNPNLKIPSNVKDVVLVQTNKKGKEENSNQLWQCVPCARVFSKEFYLSQHNNAIHSNNVSWQCVPCERVFTRESFLTQHNNAFHSNNVSWQCVPCERVFRRECFLTQHNNAIHGDSETWRCVPCERVFSRECYLTQHNNAIHGDSLTWQHKCTKCGKKFSSDDKLKTHLKRHGEKPLLCSTCGKTFNYQTDLKRHMYNHNKKPLSCPKCSKKFVRNDHLARHMEIHTRKTKAQKMDLCVKT